MRIGGLLAALSAILIFAGAAAAVSVTVVVDYDPGLGELPEGVAVGYNASREGGADARETDERLGGGGVEIQGR